MAVDVLLGLQWGDEGKGKIVDYLAPHYDIVARFQGGPNAGHTLKMKDQTFVLHTVPSGIFNEKIINLIGNGVVLDPVVFKKEVVNLLNLGVDVSSRLLLSKKAHLILPTHRLLDAASETAKGKSKIGSTLKGIAPAYMDKTGRNGLRLGDLLAVDFKEKYQYLTNKHIALLDFYKYEFDLTSLEEEWLEAVELMRSMHIIDGEHFINQQIHDNKKILAEGAQGSLLDIDFGTYPYVTSSNTIAASACIGLGIAPRHIEEVIGISKAYCTRVGNGPVPTELDNETGEKIRKAGNEFGSTTGRPRRCGWLDLPALRYAIMLNGVSQLILTKADILNQFETIRVCTHYSKGIDIAAEQNNSLTNQEKKIVNIMNGDISYNEITPLYKELKGWNKEFTNVIPVEFTYYLEYLEKELKVKISLVSIGPERNQIINRKVKTIA